MSEIGAKLSPDCEVAVIWYYDHGSREHRVSLRSFHEHVDVSEVAKRFGGGGHRKAAGFQLSGNVSIESIFEVQESEAQDA
jgi:nanoRNase/pAp phosphatase (c-di-AMP/oligoRNAs hydrolase)